MQETTHTFCHICEQYCGLEVISDSGRVISIEPDQKNPWSWRDFCIKAAKQAAIVHHPERLRTPMRRVGDRFVPATYDEALDDIAARLGRIIKTHGPDAFGAYYGNPAAFNFGVQTFFKQLLNAIGTRNHFSVGSIDQNALHVAMENLFGNHSIALVPDIDASDCFLFIGTNPAISKMHYMGKVPDGWRRTLDRVKEGAELIVVDPRRTETAQRATLYLAPYPEQDWALLLGMIRHLFEVGLTRPDTSIPTVNRDALRQLAFRQPLERLAEIAGVSTEEIIAAAERFGRAQRPLAIANTGPGQGRHGAITQWLTLCLNLLLARLDAPGGRYMPAWPYSFAELGEKSPSKRMFSRVRKLPAVANQFAVAEIPDEILTPGEGQIRAFLLHAGNIVTMGPEGDRLDRAFASLELLVAVDLFQRESHRHAHWLIPGVHFLERGETLASLFALNDRPFIQTGRKAVDPPPGVMQEWRFLLELGRRLDVPMFPGEADPNPDMLVRRMLANSPITLEQIQAAEHGLEFGERKLDHLSKFLSERGRKVDLTPKPMVELLEAALSAGPELRDGDFPLRMISRRRNNMMNSWMADTIGQQGTDIRQDVVEMNAGDAARQGLSDGQRVAVESRVARLEARVRCSDKVRRGVVVMEHGWGTRIYRPHDGSVASEVGVNRNRLVAGDDVAALTGVPRLNGTPVRVTAL